MAEALGVSYVSVNRWENGARPSRMAWDLLRGAEARLAAPRAAGARRADESPAPLDFTADAEHVRLVAEAERLSFGHLASPAFATEISLVDPLPHQRIAVYEHMLVQPRLRFLLADDAGAGKTIMTGLYVREMLARRLLRRVLIVPPAGLVGNWERELRTLFSLSFRVVRGADARSGNPFCSPDGDLVICSVDTLDQGKPLERLGEPEVEPYDLVVFDEAHKLSARQEADLTVRKTARYLLAEALAGATEPDDEHALPWTAHHLLLLTATPHMGPDFPYFALWRLLEPQMLQTPEAFRRFPREERGCRFLRRTKEEMVYLDGRPLYPQRQMDTWSFDLTQGPESEQALYGGMTTYMEESYNRAKILNPAAARLALGVFQRRLASSTFALSKSLERRRDRLDALIAQVARGDVTPAQLRAAHRRLGAELTDPFDAQTADEEESDDPGDDASEAHESAEARLIDLVIADSLADLEAERREVAELVTLARTVLARGADSKFDKLCELLRHPAYRDHKAIIFTEHRDTLVRIVERLEAMGFTDKVARIHGGMDYRERERQVEHFRGAHDRDGAQYLVATDAAGEGINLQFCWLMVNYDVPWNPARLEQRLGRIHRYGQKHDPVVVANLLAGKTREGRVLKTLLEKLEKIRKELGSDKVFDVVGRLFENVSIPDLMAQARTEQGADQATAAVEGQLTREQVAALEARERLVYGEGGDVKRDLPRLRSQVDGEVLRRLMPGYVRQFVEHSAEAVGLAVDGDLGGTFKLRPDRSGSLDALLPALDALPPELGGRLSIERPADRGAAWFLRPGEAVFDALHAAVTSRFAAEALRGAAFIDPTASAPYMFHLAEIGIVRRMDPLCANPARDEVLERRLVGIRHGGSDLPGLPPAMEICPVEHLLLLRGYPGYPAEHAAFAATAPEATVQVQEFLELTVLTRAVAERRRIAAEVVAERERFVRCGYDCRDAELAASRAHLSERARNGDKASAETLGVVKQRQRGLFARLEVALAEVRAEPARIAAGELRFIAHALVVPSRDPEERRRHDADVELMAVRIARAYEEALGATVRDVSTPPQARAAGLSDHPGFDLLSSHPSGERRAIEVKGRVGVGSIEITANEWARACILRDEYWLYAVFDCASAAPRLSRVRDPFARLLARSKGSLLLEAGEILAVGETGLEAAPKEEPLPAELRPLFWEYRFEDLRWPSQRDLVIGRVLVAGGDSALDWLRARVPDADLLRWVHERAGAGMEPRRLRYWQNRLGIPVATVDRWVAAARATPWSAGA